MKTPRRFLSSLTPQHHDDHFQLAACEVLLLSSGAVMSRGLQKVAVYRDPDGVIHELLDMK